MDENDVGALQFRLSECPKTPARLVEADIQLGKGALEPLDCSMCPAILLLLQVRKRPSTLLFIAPHLVPEANQLACQAAQEVRVAVIPVGIPGVREDAEAQAAAHATAASRLARAPYKRM